MHNPLSLATYTAAVDRLMTALVQRRKKLNLAYIESQLNALTGHVPAQAHDVHYKLSICRAVIAYYRRNFMEALYHIQQSDRLHSGAVIHRDYERVKTHILTRTCIMLGQMRQEQLRNQKTYHIVQRGLATLGFSVSCFAIGIVTGTQAYNTSHQAALIALATGCLYAGGISLCLAAYHFIRSVLRIVA